MVWVECQPANVEPSARAGWPAMATGVHGELGTCRPETDEDALCLRWVTLDLLFAPAPGTEPDPGPAAMCGQKVSRKPEPIHLPGVSYLPYFVNPVDSVMAQP